MTSHQRSSPGRLFPINIQYPHLFSEGPEGGGGGGGAVPTPFSSPNFSKSHFSVLKSHSGHG